MSTSLLPPPGTTTQDPACPTTRADQAGGGLGLLAQFLRAIADKLLPPWYYPPPNFQPFDQSGLITTPAIGTNGVVLTIKVPNGYVAVIRRLSHNIIGPGFVQGSGALIWGITIDNAPVKGYSAMLTEFGDVKTGPRPTDGIIAQSAQTIRYTVSNVSYAALGTNIVVTASGWFYPTPRPKTRVV